MQRRYCNRKWCAAAILPCVAPRARCDYCKAAAREARRPRGDAGGDACSLRKAEYAVKIARRPMRVERHESVGNIIGASYWRAVGLFVVGIPSAQRRRSPGVKGNSIGPSTNINSPSPAFASCCLSREIRSRNIALVWRPPWRQRMRRLDVEGGGAGRRSGMTRRRRTRAADAISHHRR